MAFSFKTGESGRKSKQTRLKTALFYGQHWVVAKLLRETPDLAEGDLGLQIALYEKNKVMEALNQVPALVTKTFGNRTPLLHLAFSCHFQAAPNRIQDMLIIANELLDRGADPNDGLPVEPESDHRLSVLYGALCHAKNIELGRLLLQRGANPNDNESLYHSSELDNLDGMKLLLEHGAKPEGTNALARALDFNWYEAVELLLRHGADPNEGIAPHPSGESFFAGAALHHAMRRMCTGRVVSMLLDAGADTQSLCNGHAAYALAMMYGNEEAANELKARGGLVELSPVELILADAARGRVSPDIRINPEDLTAEARRLLINIIIMPSRLEHAKRLVKIGFDFDLPDPMGLTPVQAAGWEGLPETMSWLLSLGPNLNHMNDFGGNLLSTIIHGSENCPSADQRDHVACALLALESGVRLPAKAIEFAGEQSMANCLQNWARSNPSQVMKDGPW